MLKKNNVAIQYVSLAVYTPLSHRHRYISVIEQSPFDYVAYAKCDV